MVLCVCTCTSRGKYAWGMNQCDWIFSSTRNSFEWLSSHIFTNHFNFFFAFYRYRSKNTFDNAKRINFNVSILKHSLKCLRENFIKFNTGALEFACKVCKTIQIQFSSFRVGILQVKFVWLVACKMHSLNVMCRNTEQRCYWRASLVPVRAPAIRLYPM